MYSLKIPEIGCWEIREGDKVVYSGIGTATQAALIAKQHRIIITKFIQYREVA